MSATPTPRAVLEKWLNPKGGQVYAAERIAQFETEYHAALAASGPLSAEVDSANLDRAARCIHGGEWNEKWDDLSEGERTWYRTRATLAADILRTDLLTAYSVLSAELALLNARRDEFTKGIQDFAYLTNEIAVLRGKLADIEADARAHSVNAATTADLAAANAALRATVATLEEPTMFWDADDQERSEDHVEELAHMHDYQPGSVHEIAVAHSLPNRWVAVTSDPEDEGGILVTEYATEVEARARLARTPTPEGQG